MFKLNLPLHHRTVDLCIKLQLMDIASDRTMEKTHDRDFSCLTVHKVPGGVRLAVSYNKGRVTERVEKVIKPDIQQDQRISQSNVIETVREAKAR